LAANFNASAKFAYGYAYRYYGDATCPSKDIFNATKRLSRASVSIRRAPKGSNQKDLIVIKPGRIKSMNKYAGRELVGEIDHYDPINWPAAILKLFELDPVATEDLASTPLFRDTRGLTRKANGVFPGGGE